jgi:hypothetical protein
LNSPPDIRFNHRRTSFDNNPGEDFMRVIATAVLVFGMLTSGAQAQTVKDFLGG